jgi:hypothetical protein
MQMRLRRPPANGKKRSLILASLETRQPFHSTSLGFTFLSERPARPAPADTALGVSAAGPEPGPSKTRSPSNRTQETSRDDELHCSTVDPEIDVARNPKPLTSGTHRTYEKHVKSVLPGPPRLVIISLAV